MAATRLDKNDKNCIEAMDMRLVKSSHNVDEPPRLVSFSLKFIAGFLIHLPTSTQVSVQTRENVEVIVNKTNLKKPAWTIDVFFDEKYEFSALDLYWDRPPLLESIRCEAFEID